MLRTLATLTLLCPVVLAQPERAQPVRVRLADRSAKIEAEVERLVAVVADDWAASDEDRVAAAEALVRLGTPAAVALIELYLRGFRTGEVAGPELVRRALVRMGPGAAPSLDRLRIALSGEDRERYERAVVLLAEVAPWQPDFAKEVSELQAPTDQHLARLAGRTGRRLRSTDFQWTKFHWSRMLARLEIDPCARTEKIAVELDSGDLHHREFAAQILAQRGADARGSLDALHRALDPQIPEVGTYLDGVTPAVHRALADALIAIAPHDSRAIAGYAWRLWLSNLDTDRIAAVRSLGGFGRRAAPAVPVLLAANPSGSDSVMRAVIDALGQIGPGARTALPVLTRIAERGWGNDEDMPELASAAIARITRRK